ncbi:hypothetical protein Bca4012_076056 [Brassica carinata]
MHRRKKKATDETAGVKLPTKRRRKEINNSLPIIGNPHIPQVGLTHRNGDHPNVFVDITNTQNTIQREARNQRANILRQKRKFAGPNVSNDQLTQPSLLPKLSVELPQQRGHVEATIPTQSSILTNGSGFIPRKKLKVTRNKNLSSGFAAHNTSQSSQMSNQVSQISSKGNSLEDNFVVRSHEPDNATACILSDFTEPIQANRSKAIRQRSTSQPSIIDQQDSDSSDSCDAYWDCSSNEGGDEIAPSDESDDDVEYNKKKFACMEHVSKYSAEVFGGLVIPQTREDNMVVSPVITEAGLIMSEEQILNATLILIENIMHNLCGALVCVGEIEDIEDDEAGGGFKFITNTEVSQILFDEDIPEIQEFKKSYALLGDFKQKTTWTLLDILNRQGLNRMGRLYLDI